MVADDARVAFEAVAVELPEFRVLDAHAGEFVVVLPGERNDHLGAGLVVGDDATLRVEDRDAVFVAHVGGGQFRSVWGEGQRCNALGQRGLEGADILHGVRVPNVDQRVGANLEEVLIIFLEF